MPRREAGRVQLQGLLLQRAGLTRATGATGAVTLVQRFGSALNLNIDFHASEQRGEHRGVASAGGFSLHAGIGIAPGRRQKLERLCRYVSRPPVSLAPPPADAVV